MARGKKKLKILVGCNLLTSVDSLVYPNHMQMWYRLGRNYPDIEFFCCMPRRMPIDTARNMAAKVAIEQECDYLFFYDDDVIVPVDALSKLIAAKADVAAGLTYIRGVPFNPMIFEMKKDGKNWTLPYMRDFKKKAKGTIVDCHAVGFSCVLIDMTALKSIPAPYFMTGTNNTEDVYFCCKLKDHNPKAKIVVDYSVSTAHLLDKFYVEDGNVDALRDFFKGLGEEDPKAKKYDRTYEKAKKSLEVISDAKSAA